MLNNHIKIIMKNAMQTYGEVEATLQESLTSELDGGE
jgi:hypothetical protein